jgi:pimeloyl-ACP methyl ester carboxylesterase
VASIGGHDDLGRVLGFFVTNSITRPDGSVQQLHAHDYGPLVLVYSHVEGFFPAADAPLAREALRYWLWEEFDTARTRARQLGPESRARMEALFDHKVETIKPELLAEIDRQKGYFPSVSPAGRLALVRAPIFLLHGAGDTVIPASETEWLAHDAPPAWLAEALVSQAISHVELEGEPSLGDRLRLVHFIAGVLGRAR